MTREEENMQKLKSLCMALFMLAIILIGSAVSNGGF